MLAPIEVTATLMAHLGRLDRAAPGLVDGLYVTGSIALGDFVPDRSDVDFLAVLGREPDAGDLDALAEAHADLVGGPHYDGVYVTRPMLAEAPDDGRARTAWPMSSGAPSRASNSTRSPGSNYAGMAYRSPARIRPRWAYRSGRSGCGPGWWTTCGRTGRTKPTRHGEPVEFTTPDGLDAVRLTRRVIESI